MGCFQGHETSHAAAYATLQGFKQRVENYLQYLPLRYFVMSDTSTAERRLSAKFGFNADGSWLSRSTAAAIIVMGDWALEWPFPVPPKVHVGYIPVTEPEYGSHPAGEGLLLKLLDCSFEHLTLSS